MKASFLRRLFRTHREAALDEVMRAPEFRDLQNYVRQNASQKAAAQIQAETNAARLRAMQ
jgi:hypothetical protein